jgi:glycosyltransferase involved in cell wall biosynthesis
MTRQWTINGRFLTQPLTGVQRYARETIAALDHLIDTGHPLARGLSIELVCPPGANDDLCLKKIVVRTAGRGRGHYWEQVELPTAASGGVLSLCNVGPLAAKRHVVCIHDVNTILAPASYSRQFRMLYRWLLPAIGRRATKVATVSHFSAAQIDRFAIAPASKIEVISNGREHALRWSPQHSPVTQAAAGDGTIVVIGSPAPHKNVGMLIGLADQLASVGLKLAIVGSLDGKVFASGNTAPISGNIAWLGRLTDGEIAALLQDCLCLAFPSFTEGFGLPPLEAMTLGCPVVSSDRASLPEICADGALFAPPDAPDAWLARFMQLKRDKQLRADMRRRGQQAAQRYSWARSAERYLEVLAAVDGVALPAERPASVTPRELASAV